MRLQNVSKGVLVSIHILIYKLHSQGRKIVYNNILRLFCV